MASTRVECDRCGLKVRLRKDGTVEPHEYTSRRLDHNWRTIPGSRKRQKCENSGEPYAFHMGTFFVSRRAPDGSVLEWTAACRCGQKWYGPTHDEAAEKWRGHARRAESGRAPARAVPHRRSMGNVVDVKTNGMV